jgi:hypothetical protein
MARAGGGALLLAHWKEAAERAHLVGGAIAVAGRRDRALKPWPSLSLGAIGGIADMPRSLVTHPGDANDPTRT